MDWETHPGLGMEYDDYRIGDGGFAARFSDGTVTDGTWKAETFYVAPVDGAGCVVTGAGGARDSSGCPARPACATREPTACRSLHFPEPDGWTSPSFDDSAWPAATVWRESEVSPKPAYSVERSLFGAAQFVWSKNLTLDNLVLLRRTVTQP